MHKVDLVIYFELEVSGKAALYRALMSAEEHLRAGDDVALVFVGAGSNALADMLKPDNDPHHVWTKVALALRGGRSYCAKSDGVKNVLEPAGITLLSNDKGHASLRKLLLEGRQIITFRAARASQRRARELRGKGDTSKARRRQRRSVVRDSMMFVGAAQIQTNGSNRQKFPTRM